MKLADRIILHLLKYGRKDPSEIMIPNFYHFGYEMDVFKLMSKNRYVVEYEVKISRADYFNDFKKMREWLRSAKNKYKHDAIREGDSCNRFFFVVPEGLIKREEVPAHCGLMEFCQVRDVVPFYTINTIKPAPLIHKKEFTDFEHLAKSLSWREDRWRRKSYKNERLS